MSVLTLSCSDFFNPTKKTNTVVRRNVANKCNKLKKGPILEKHLINNINNITINATANGL